MSILEVWELSASIPNLKPGTHAVKKKDLKRFKAANYLRLTREQNG